MSTAASDKPTSAPPVRPAITLDAGALEQGLSCVHCGLCLPACPTFNETGHEADSPRGRIQLMLALDGGRIEATESVRRHLDLCLDCRGCETACPSGVVYHELIEPARRQLAAGRRRAWEDRLMRRIFFDVFVHPTRLKAALFLPRLLQKVGVYPLLRRSGLFKLLPPGLRKMERMLPAGGAVWPRRLPAVTRAQGQKNFTVGFFAGCIGSVLFEDVNRQAIELLAACGAEVRVAPGQACCGAIHDHNGARGPAGALARLNIDAFVPENDTPVDFIVTAIAGCGAMLREYDRLLKDDPRYAGRASDFSSRVRDVSELLLAIGLPEPAQPIDAMVTYHDACHLAHAQKVTAAPRKLLERIPGLTQVPLPESDLCCGAAGTYNLTQPEMSGRLAARKLMNIKSTGATVCVTGNAGCAMQIRSEADAAGIRLEVLHPVQLLHRSVFGAGPG